MEFGKNGTAAFLKRSSPTYCDVDAADLKARLSSPKQ